MSAQGYRKLLSKSSEKIKSPSKLVAFKQDIAFHIFKEDDTN